MNLLWSFFIVSRKGCIGCRENQVQRKKKKKEIKEKNENKRRENKGKKRKPTPKDLYESNTTLLPVQVPRGFLPFFV